MCSECGLVVDEQTRLKKEKEGYTADEIKRMKRSEIVNTIGNRTFIKNSDLSKTNNPSLYRRLSRFNNNFIGKERVMNYCLTEIQKFDFNKLIKKEAKRLFFKIISNYDVKFNNRYLLLACLYYSAKIRTPLTSRDIINKLNIYDEENLINKINNTLKKIHKIELNNKDKIINLGLINKIKLKESIQSYADKMNLSYELTNKIISNYELIKEKLNGLSNSGVLAAIIYYTLKEEGESMPQRTISKIFNITEPTLRSIVKKISAYKILDEIKERININNKVYHEVLLKINKLVNQLKTDYFNNAIKIIVGVELYKKGELPQDYLKKVSLSKPEVIITTNNCFKKDYFKILKALSVY